MTLNELFAKREQLMQQREATINSMNVAKDKNDEAAFAAAEREYKIATSNLDLVNGQINFQESHRETPKTTNAIMRESLVALRDGQKREIVFAGSSNSIENSGAINLKIHDVMPTLNEGLGLPTGVTIQTGVTGNELWPVSVNDLDAVETGENTALTDQNLDFDKITPLVKRVGVLVDVSNKAIDEAAFDVLSFVQNKITLAQRKYLAKKVYSQYPWATGNVKGPFSGLASSGTITVGTDNVFQKILEAVAAFADKGFDLGSFCMVMDAATEAKLKATPKATGQGGFIIENGKCAGYNYVVSHYINTKAKGGSGSDKDDFVTGTDKFIGMGCWDYLAVQQHGDVRLTRDNSSKAMASVNKTNFTLNTEWSITDLSVKINTKGGTTTQAFALYKLA